MYIRCLHRIAFVAGNHENSNYMHLSKVEYGNYPSCSHPYIHVRRAVLFLALFGLAAYFGHQESEDVCM